MRAGKQILFMLTALVMTLCVFASAQADVTPIPLDILAHGTPPKAEGWIVPEREYQDESIHVVLEEKRRHKSPTSDNPVDIHWVVIEIKDPSQLRATLSYDSFDVKTKATAQEMVSYLNAVVAFNDDYVKMNNFKGYVIRQGQLFLDNLDDWEEKLKQDVLLIDDRGDFSVVRKASSADVQARTAELEADGRKVVNAFTFGPALILDGEVQEFKREDSTHALNLAVARTVFCQLDTLKYAVFAVDAPNTGDGMNCREIAEFILKTFPECKVAYNLDGGGSSKLFLGQKKVNKAPGRREIQGMIYFASAAPEE